MSLPNEVDVEKHLDEHQENVPRARLDDEVVVDTEAAGYLDHNIVIDEATDRRLFWAITKRVFPCMALTYLGQGLDKGVLSTASIMGIQKDTHMVGQDYALATTTFWVGIIAAEFPANRLVQIMPLGKLMAVALILWGLILIPMALVTHAVAVQLFRFVLGILEAVCGPVLLAMSVMWYKRSEQVAIVNGYQCFYGLSSILSGLFAWGFYQVHDDNLYSWQILYLMIMGVSILFGTFVLFWCPDSPTRAKCFSEEDKRLMVERVRSNEQGIKNTVWNWSQFKEAISDVYIYCLFFMTFFNTITGVGAFGNLLINQAFGFDVLQSQLLSMPTGTLLVLIYAATAWVVTKTRQTIYVILGLAVFNWAGAIILITVTPSTKTRAGLLIAYYMLQGYQGQNPLLFQLCSRNVAGQTKRTVAYAATFLGWAVGNAVNPQLFQSRWAPRYIKTLYIILAMYGIHAVVIIGTRFLLVQRNKKKERAMEGREIRHLHAFEDLTDKQNPDFRYIY